MRRAAIPVLAGALVAVLAGCATAPAPASQPVPAAWSGLPSLPAPAAPDDPTLARLLADVQVGPDSAAARARAEAAAAQAAAVRAALAPALTLSGSASRATPQPGFGPPVAGQVGASTIALRLDAPLDAAGAGRARSRAAQASAVAAAAEAERVALVTRRSAAVLLESWRGAQAQTQILTEAAAAASQTATLVADRNRAGLAAGLELAQARAAQAAIDARLPLAAQAEAAARRGLEALAGTGPGALDALLAGDRMPQTVAVPDLQAPAAVLERRPDVRAAGALARSAGLEARAAQRDRWPSLSLSALIGRSDPGFAAAADTESRAVSLLAPVFDFGRLAALSDAAGARSREAAALYRSALAGALADVAVSASRMAHAREARERQEQAASAAIRRQTLTGDRYRAGLASLIDLLEARQGALEARIALVAARQEEASAAHGLRAALGG